MAAGHEDSGQHGGMDALMAAITGDPLPQDARRDPGFLAEHRAAEADLAVLREQLTWLAEALTGRARTGESGSEVTAPAPEGEEAGLEGLRRGGSASSTGPAEPASPAETGEPGRPAEPAEQAEPAGFVAPAGSAAPAEPAGTVESAAPAESVPPAEPVASAEPAGSAEPADRAGSAEVAGSAAPVGPAGSTARREHRPRGGGRPASGARPAGSPRSGRPAGRRRVLRVALGSVGGVAALGMVAGLFWLGAQPGGDASMSGGGSADAKSGADAPAPGAGRPADPVAALACYRLVAEGTVAAVDRHSRSPWIRVVLTVTRSYRPAHGPEQVSFLLAGDARPAPRRGQHVLAGVDRGRRDAGLWAVGDARVAEQRAWITEALPGSRHAACPR